MKKIFSLFAILLFVVGCGSKPTEQSASDQPRYEGVVDPSAQKPNYVALGMQYLAKSDLQKALQSFDMAIKEDPSNIQNYLVLGEVYMRLTNYPRAIDTLAAALKVAPNSGEIYYMLATCQALSGDKQSAIINAEKSVYIFSKVNNDQEKTKKAAILLSGLVEVVKEEQKKQSMSQVKTGVAATVNNVKK